ncbi:MAG: NYN domain-containing protein, partial [Vicinamibacterales bacterium]
RARFDVPGATFITTEVVEGGKSLLDTQLVIEAAVHDLRIGADTYLVMSGDADMVPLVRWLKARQRNVVGAGRTHSAAARLTEVCDQFALLSAKVSQQPLASAPAGLDPNARRLRDLVEELLGDRLEYPAAKLNTELRAAIAHNFGRDPDRHLQEVLGIARFKQVISALYPDGELRVSEAGSAVERSVIDEPPDEDGPAFRGALGPLSRSGGLEEPELQPWDPARVQVLDLPELVV